MFWMTSDMKMEMGRRIRQLMDGPPKTTSETLGEALGVTPGAITKWRKEGKIRDEHKLALCRYFNVSLDWLVAGQGGGPNERERRSLSKQVESLPLPEVRRLQAIVDALAIPADDEKPNKANH
jgi:hypothetical protein